MLTNILLGLFIVLQLLDIYTTNKALKTGKASEKNPLMKVLMGKLGIIPAMVIPKVIVIGLALYFVEDTFEWRLILGLFSVAFVFVVWNNYNVGKRHGAYK